jgi:hypothetical protein
MYFSKLLPASTRLIVPEYHRVSEIHCLVPLGKGDGVTKTVYTRYGDEAPRCGCGADFVAYVAGKGGERRVEEVTRGKDELEIHSLEGLV